MRRSQAPSNKTKSHVTSSINENVSLKTVDSGPENTLEKRSTESVLNLLNGFESCLAPENEGDTKPLEIRREGKRARENENFHTHEEPSTAGESSSETNPQSITSQSTVFNVVYGKQTKKKHKTWEGDGVLEVNSKFLTLRDENGKVIGRGSCSKFRKLEQGERLCLGNKEVELLNLVNENVPNPSPKNESELFKTKRNSLIPPKRFQVPRSCYSTGMPLPDPNAEHQWQFNEKGLPVTPVFVEESLSKKLRQHQYEGITFLYECIMGFKDIKHTGAILADEMGLGKTLQCISLIWTLLKQGPYGNVPVVKKVIIVTPSGLTMNWYNEFLKWLGRVKLVPFVISQKNKVSDFRGPVMIISYEMLVRCIEDVELHKFDLLVCDEGHRLKNAGIKTTQTLNRLNCPRRILLTGTPLQNDLNEFYALVDFVNPNALGTPADFRREFAERILASRQPNADETVLARGRESARNLKRITAKFLLRRTRDILKNYLPPRRDVVVFCKIAQAQKKRYNSVIDSIYDVKNNGLPFLEGSSYLEFITLLKKICNHPSLIGTDELEEVPRINDSGKLVVTMNFLRELRTVSPKEKVVIVSSSTRMLDLLEKILHVENYTTCRLDGNTPLHQRNRVVEKFNDLNGNNANAFVFLLSSKAGGVGLNVTGGSRLILYDSDWNPATDLQAISRIWRDGQKYPVYVYRFLTAGTIEEKIYQRQLSKLGLCDGTVDPENNKSIKLSKEELKELFFFSRDDFEDCLTHEALACDCSKRGEIPVVERSEEDEEEERNCQLVKSPSNSRSKISELFHWEHHGRPFQPDFMCGLCLETSQDDILFIFHS